MTRHRRVTSFAKLVWFAKQTIQLTGSLILPPPRLRYAVFSLPAISIFFDLRVYRLRRLRQDAQHCNTLPTGHIFRHHLMDLLPLPDERIRTCLCRTWRASCHGLRHPGGKCQRQRRTNKR